MHVGGVVEGYIANFYCTLSLLFNGRVGEYKRQGVYGPSGHRVILLSCTEIAPLGVVVLNISMSWCTRGLPGENRMGLLQLAKPGF